MNAKNERENDLDFDLEITRVRPTQMGGTWVCGTVDGEFRFDALVFAEHAEVTDYELNASRISKLWIAKTANKETVFNWDRGMDIPAADNRVQSVVDFLCEGLADLVCND